MIPLSTYIYILTTFILAVPILAQDFSSLPLCGKSCIGIALSKAPSLGCTTSDAKCLCSNVKIRSIIQTCISSTCEPKDADRTLAFAISACGQGSTPNVSVPPTPNTSQSSTTQSQTPSSTAQEASSASLQVSTETEASSVSSSITSVSPDSSATLITSTAASSPSPSLLPTSPSNSTPEKPVINETSLPISTKIALGITIPLVVILAAALTWFIINRRRNRVYLSPYPIAYDGEGIPKMEPEPEPGVMHEQNGSGKMSRSGTIWLL